MTALAADPRVSEKTGQILSRHPAASLRKALEAPEPGGVSSETSAAPPPCSQSALDLYYNP